MRYKVVEEENTSEYDPVFSIFKVVDKDTLVRLYDERCYFYNYDDAVRWGDGMGWIHQK